MIVAMMCCVFNESGYMGRRCMLPPAGSISNAEANPSITFSYTASSQQYGYKTGNRLFIPTNIFKKGFSVPRAISRKYPIHINYGYSDTDSICIKLPDGYIVEGLPKPIDLKSKFGNFHSSIYTKDNKIYAGFLFCNRIAGCLPYN